MSTATILKTISFAAAATGASALNGSFLQKLNVSETGAGGVTTGFMHANGNAGSSIQMNSGTDSETQKEVGPTVGPTDEASEKPRIRSWDQRSRFTRAKDFCEDHPWIFPLVATVVATVLLFLLVLWLWVQGVFYPTESLNCMWFRGASWEAMHRYGIKWSELKEAGMSAEDMVKCEPTPSLKDGVVAGFHIPELKKAGFSFVGVTVDDLLPVYNKNEATEDDYESFFYNAQKIGFTRTDLREGGVPAIYIAYFEMDIDHPIKLTKVHYPLLRSAGYTLEDLRLLNMKAEEALELEPQPTKQEMEAAGFISVNDGWHTPFLDNLKKLEFYEDRVPTFEYYN